MTMWCSTVCTEFARKNKDVEIRDHERLYYTAKYTPICIYCSMEQPFTKEKEYPICNNCCDKPAVHMSTRATH